MSRLWASVSLAVTATALLSSIAPAVATAAPWQADYFEPAAIFANRASRPEAVRQMQHLGVRALRIVLPWANVAPRPDSRRLPRFDQSSPAGYDWSYYAEEIEEAKRLRWPVLLTVTGPVPTWASANRRDHLTNPDAGEFRRFMTAVARRFAGDVALWAIWNEPNQVGWLQPQFNADGTPASPRIYRGLFLAGYAGLQAAGLSAPKVLMGETAPFGNSHVDARSEGLVHNTSPLAFLRGALCLNSEYRMVGRCAQLPAYGFGHHAYTNSQGPSFLPAGADEVTIGSLGRLDRALELAADAHAIRRSMPVFLTEFGINTRPNALGVSPYEQAVQDAISEHIAWEDPRVASFSQYELRDDAIPRRRRSGWIGFQTGLERADGRPKPLFFAWSLPLVVRREAGGYYLWGCVRPAGGPTSAEVLVQPARGKPFRLLTRVSAGRYGYWVARTRRPGVAWRVRWRSPAGVRYEGAPMPAS